MSVINEQKIMKELEAIRKDLDFIRVQMVDIYTMTSGGEKILEIVMKKFNLVRKIKEMRETSFPNDLKEVLGRKEKLNGIYSGEFRIIRS